MLGLGLSLSLGAQQGGGGEPAPVEAPWYLPNTIVDLDYENSRFYVDGVEYASKAEMVAAGFYTIDDTNGDYMTLPSMPSTYCMFAEAVNSSTSSPSPSEVMFNLKGSGTAGQNGANVITVVRGSMIGYSGRSSGGSQVWSQTGASTGANGTQRLGFRVRSGTGGIAFGRNLNTTVTATASSLPVVTTLYIGNRDARDAKWGGTVKRIAIIGEDMDNRSIQVLPETIAAQAQPIAIDVTYTPWYSEPSIAQIKDGVMVLGYTTERGWQGIAEVDTSTKRLLRIRQVHNFAKEDEHFSPAVTFLSDGSLFVWGTDHDGTNTIYTYKSATGRIADIGSEVTVTNTMTAPNYNATAEYVTGGLLYIMTNDDKSGVSSPNRKPVITMFRSEDGGDTFTQCQPITGLPSAEDFYNQLYTQYARPDDATLWMFGALHDSKSDAIWRLLQVDLATGDVSYRLADGTDVPCGNMLDTPEELTPLTTFSDLPAPFTKATGKKQVELTLADDGSMALVQEVDNGTESNSVYTLYRLTGSNPWNPADWTSVVVPWGTNCKDACFAREPHSGIRIYFADNQGEVGAPNRIVRADSSDNGANWKLTVIAEDALDLRRPVSPKGATTSFPVIWVRHTARTDNTDFDTDTMWPA